MQFFLINILDVQFQMFQIVQVSSDRWLTSQPLYLFTVPVTKTQICFQLFMLLNHSKPSMSLILTLLQIAQTCKIIWKETRKKLPHKNTSNFQSNACMSEEVGSEIVGVFLNKVDKGIFVEFSSSVGVQEVDWMGGMVGGFKWGYRKAWI